MAGYDMSQLLHGIAVCDRTRLFLASDGGGDDGVSWFRFLSSDVCRLILCYDFHYIAVFIPITGGRRWGEIKLNSLIFRFYFIVQLVQ